MAGATFILWSNKNKHMTNAEYWHAIEQWRHETGNSEIDMEQVAHFAHAKLNWPLPPPLTGIARLAKLFAKVARQATKQDGQTGRSYRVYHAFPAGDDYQGRMLWFDIDDEHATRDQMLKSAVRRREQMVGDAVQLTLDLDHFNRTHPKDEPIILPNDLQPDVDWRLNGPDASAA
jgi:hypothetical protein